MGFEKKSPPPDESPSAPLWMITFSDCMNLLLTFFILLVTFSSFEEEPFIKLRMAFQKALPSLIEQKEKRKPKTSIVQTYKIWPSRNPYQGSEKPTLESGSRNRLEEETEPGNFRSRRVFLISSDKIFYGNGTIISFQGRKILSTMASFLKEIPDRVIISENGGKDNKKGDNLRLERAWAIMAYLTQNRQLDKKLFSLSAANITNSQQNRQAGDERTIEITLLERSIYN